MMWKRIGWGVGGVGLGLLAVFTLRHALSPSRFLPTDRPWVFVSPGCPYSTDIHAQIRAAGRESPLWQLVVVPADANPGARAASLSLCSTTFEQIEWNETWFSGAIPHALACRWLVEDAALHVQSVGIWPAWFWKGEFVQTDLDIDAMLASHGLVLDVGTNTLLEAGRDVPESRRRPAIGSESVWDDLSEPHIVGW